LFKITFEQNAEYVFVLITIILLRIAVGLESGYFTTTTKIWRETRKLWSSTNIKRLDAMLIGILDVGESFAVSYLVVLNATLHYFEMKIGPQISLILYMNSEHFR